jgi:molybdopterin-biosynthesis enzyme MoeA-like protein
MYARKKAQAKAMLSARGLEGSSIEQEVMNEIDKWYQQNYYALLNQQLQDALTMAGLGESDIRAILEELKAYGIMTAGLGAGLQAGAQIWTGRILGLSQGGATLGKSLGELAGTTGTTTGVTQGLNLAFQDLDIASKFKQTYQPTQWKFKDYGFGG